VFHLQGDLIDPTVLKSREDLLGTTSPSTLIYAALDGWRRQMVEHGRALYDAALALAGDVRGSIADIDGMRVHGRDDLCGPGRATDMDPLQVVIDVSAFGTTGYRIADRLRRTHRVNLHLADHRRISAQLTHADDETSAERLLAALRDVPAQAPQLRPAPEVEVPDPADLRLEQVMLPRDAYFGRVEQVPWEKAVGRVSAEMLTPYPPGIPVALPGERLNEAALRYLRSGAEAGMVVPDGVDPEVKTVRVTVEDRPGS
jgi:arginine decarboxylase